MTLGKGESEYGSKARDTGAGPELIAPGGLRDEVQVDDSSNEISAGISLLHDPATKTTSLYGEVLKRRSGGQTPNTSHTDTEKTTDGEKLVEGLNEAATKGERRDEEEIGNQWPFSTKPIRDETKYNL